MKRLGFSVLNHEVSGVKTVLDAREWMGAVKQPDPYGLRLSAWDTRSGYEEPRNELQLQPPFTAREYFGEDYEECCEGMLAVTWSLGTKAGFEECRALGFNSKYEYELYKKLGFDSLEDYEDWKRLGYPYPASTRAPERVPLGYPYSASIRAPERDCLTKDEHNEITRLGLGFLVNRFSRTTYENFKRYGNPPTMPPIKAKYSPYNGNKSMVSQFADERELREYWREASMLPLSPQYERYKAGGFLSFYEYEASLILGFDNEAEFGKFRESGDYDETCREVAHHRMLLMKKSPVSVALEPIELCPRSYLRCGGNYYHHVWNDRGSEKTRFFFHICKEQCRSPNPPFRPIERQQLNEDPLYQRLLIMNDERECRRFNTVANAERWGAVSAEELAKMYEHGDAYNNIEQNDAKALEWYQKAEVRQQGRCAYRLGRAYEHAELGLLQSNENAVEWYQKKSICPQNSGYRLGKAYEHGELGLPQNDEKAATAYRDAADRCIAERGSQHTPYGRSGKVYQWDVVRRMYKAYKNGELGLEKNQEMASRYARRGGAG